MVMTNCLASWPSIFFVSPVASASNSNVYSTPALSAAASCSTCSRSACMLSMFDSIQSTISSKVISAYSFSS